MRIILFVILVFVFYVLSVVMYKKYHGKKLLFYYLICLLGISIMYALGLLLSVKYSADMMEICHDFFKSMLVIVMTNLIIITMKSIVNLLVKFMMGFHVKYNGLIIDDKRIQLIDKSKSLFIKWNRYLYLTGCMILIIGCMLG